MFSTIIAAVTHHIGYMIHFFNEHDECAIADIDFLSALFSIFLSSSPTHMLSLSEFKLFAKLIVLFSNNQQYKNDHVASASLIIDIITLLFSSIGYFQSDDHIPSDDDDEEEFIFETE